MKYWISIGSSHLGVFCKTNSIQITHKEGLAVARELQPALPCGWSKISPPLASSHDLQTQWVIGPYHPPAATESHRFHFRKHLRILQSLFSIVGVSASDWQQTQVYAYSSSSPQLSSFFNFATLRNSLTRYAKTSINSWQRKATATTLGFCRACRSSSRQSILCQSLIHRSLLLVAISYDPELLLLFVKKPTLFQHDLQSIFVRPSDFAQLFLKNAAQHAPLLSGLHAPKSAPGQRV